MSDRTTYIELFWRCPECGEDHISAIPDLNPTGWYCPNCFFRRDERVTLYEADDSREITDPELIQRIEEGRADWKCKYCGGLNEDKGWSKDALVCGLCNMPQTDIDESGVIRDETEEAVSMRTEVKDRLENPVVPRSLREDKYGDYDTGNAPPKSASASQSSPKKSKRKSLIALMAGGAVIGGGVWTFTPKNLEVSVDALPWQVTVEVQELRPDKQSGWQKTVPVAAYNRRSERRQRGTRQVQRGTKTIQVDESYQSGTKTESYTVSERYKSGTKKKCSTVTTGTGAGKKTCRDVAVYSTRSVPKTRQVPVYSKRKVNKEVANMVTEPVYDRYVYYTIDQWQPQKTLTNSGRDDERRLAPVTRLTNSPYKQRALAPQTVCRLTGSYEKNNKPQVKTWTIPCEQFDLLDEGDKALLSTNRPGQVSLAEVLKK